ncbi:unnamed protein product, partial [marine sediment metagenome]
DGTPTAHIHHEDNTLAVQHMYRKGSDFNNADRDKIVTFSSFVGPINRDWIRFRILDTIAIHANFDVTNGVIGALSNTFDAGIIPAPNNFYRCWMSWISQESINRIDYQIGIADNVTGFDGLDQDSLAYWRPQLNPGSGPDPVDSVPIRTNTNLVAAYSDLTVGWATEGGGSVDPTPIEGPTTGVFDAYRVHDDGSTVWAALKATLPPGILPVGGQYCYYAYLKEGTAVDASLRLWDTGAAVLRIDVDYEWVAGNLQIKAENVGTGGTVDLGNGWWVA